MNSRVDYSKHFGGIDKGSGFRLQFCDDTTARIKRRLMFRKHNFTPPNHLKDKTMSLPAATNHYSAPRRWLHWGIAALMIAGIICVELHEYFPKNSSTRNLLMGTHFQFGMLIFILALPRIMRALREGKPPIAPPLSSWQRILSSATHGLLYLVMIAMPILGVLAVQSGGYPLAFFGVPLPQLIGADKEISHTLHELHENIGNVAIALIILHAAAAYWHHFSVKDNTLTRMLSPKE